METPARPWHAVLRRLLLPCLLLLVAGCYWEILHTFFVQDDFCLLSVARRPWPNLAMLRGACFFRPLSSYWLPLLNVSLWNLKPFWHHATYFVLFLTTLVFLYDWLRSLTGSVAAASAGTILYAFSKTHLYTLAWIAGGIDVSAALCFVIGLWAVDRYLKGQPARRQRRLLWVIGISFGCGLLCKESCVVLAPACLAWIAARKIAARQPWDSAERKLAIVLIAILAVYLPIWKLVSIEAHRPASQLQCDPWRAMIVLRNSVIAVIPANEADLPQKNKWAGLPLALAALAALRRRSLASTTALLVLGLSLWILPAAIFVLTKYPWKLQLYYAHFSVIGLAVLTALAVQRILDACNAFRAAKIGFACVVVVIAAVWIGLAGGTIRDGIRNRASPALVEADMAKTVYEQLDGELRSRPVQRIVFVDTSGPVWASIQFGEMIGVLFPAVRVDYAGRNGFEPQKDLRTSATTLVARSGDRGLTVVR